ETSAPFGHELDETPLPFEIELGQQDRVEVTKENERTPGGVELLKVGEEEEPLEGAEFALQDAEGNELQSGLTTDEDGLLMVDGLAPGNYQFVETSAPFGHELDETPLPFEIELGQQDRVEVT
ncbi:collagen binding domain-containing protein, partial [Virgibacillus oceani]